MSIQSTSPSLDTIQMLWVRGNLSRMELLSIRSFLAHGHQVHLYTYAPPDNAPPGVILQDAAEIVPEKLAPEKPTEPFSKGSMGAFSDYFRYKLLVARGGWWVDTDVVALRPWLNFPEIVAASTNELGHGRTANGFVMRFTVGHHVPAACLSALGSWEPNKFNISQTGPLLLDRILGPAGISQYCQSSDVFAPVPWNASDQIVRPRLNRMWAEFKHRLRRPHLASHFTRATVAIHLWHETWRAAGRDKNIRQPTTSLYEQLHRRYGTG